MTTYQCSCGVIRNTEDGLHLHCPSNIVVLPHGATQALYDAVNRLSVELEQMKRERDELQRIARKIDPETRNAAEMAWREKDRLAAEGRASLLSTQCHNALESLRIARTERDEALADGVLSQRVCDLHNEVAQLRAERDAVVAVAEQAEQERAWRTQECDEARKIADDRFRWQHQVQQDERERIALRFSDLRADCMATYMGGYSHPDEIEIFRHGMATVCNVVDAVIAAIRSGAASGRE